MAYGLCRVRALKLGDLASAEMHNMRKYEEAGLPVPDNIRTGGNIADLDLVPNNDFLKQTLSFIEENDIKGMRKDSRVAIEMVLGCSDRRMIDQMGYERFLYESLNFVLNLTQEEGVNIISLVLHDDETTPHVHVVFTPMQTKEVVKKNRFSSKTVKENRLAICELIDGRSKLSALQDKYFDHLVKVQEAWAGWHPEYRPVELFRGTLAEKQLKEYTKHTNWKIGALRADLERCKTEVEKKRILESIESIQEKAESKANELQKIIEKKRMGALPAEWKAQGVKEDTPKPSYRRKR